MMVEAVIFDVDGVLVASPHEQAWRAALQDLMTGEWSAASALSTYTPQAFTTQVYQAQVAGKPRLSGALAALNYFGVPDAHARASTYAERKQELIEELIGDGAFTPFDDAVRFALALQQREVRLAIASSSRNATSMLRQIRIPRPLESPDATLLELFEVNVCGRDLPAGKPDPAIFKLAADELHVPIRRCLVIEDAPAGIQAAKNADMLAIGVARLDDGQMLSTAGADLVVRSLDEVSLDTLRSGQLRTTHVPRMRA